MAASCFHRDIYSLILQVPAIWHNIRFEHELTSNRQRLFAITLSMFSGLKYPDFMDIYEMVLQTMHIDREEERSPPYFRTRDDELLAQIEAEIILSDDGLEEIITFEDERYAIAVFNLMRRRHRKVLLHLLPVLKQAVGKHRSWEIRRRAALATAEIGKIGFHWLRSQVLEPWARNSRPYVRAAVGYPLARLAEDETSRSAVEDLLDDWTDAHWNGPGETWRYRWTAASTFKQIGTIETNGADWAIDWACRGLKKVAEFDDIRLADSVIHSLVVLSLQGHLERVLLTIKDWIEKGSAGSKDDSEPETGCIVGILAFMVLSEIHIELATEEEREAEESGVEAGNLFNLVRQSESEEGEYWELVISLGVQAYECGSGEAFWDLIVLWSQYDPLLDDSLGHLVVDILAEIRPRRREHSLEYVSGSEPAFDADNGYIGCGLFPNDSPSDNGFVSAKSIVDSERESSLERQIMTHRRNLNRLQEQLAKYGEMDAPLHLLNQIDDEKAKIRCKEKLLEEIGGRDA